MNKAQKTCIAETLSAILHKLEKCEDRLASAQDNGDADAVARISARLMMTVWLAVETVLSAPSRETEF